jgi:hypothetical protein
VCSVWLTACAPGILGSKASKEKIPGTASATDRPRLTKPTMPKDGAHALLAQQNDGEKPGTSSGKSPGTFAAPAKGARAEKSIEENVSTIKSNLGKDAPDSGGGMKPSGQSSSEIQKSGASVRTAVADVHGDPKTSGKAGPSASPKDGLPFKRHDHKKYIQKIKNKAIDKLNKTKDVTYATLCRDSTTDEWSLWLYSFGGKTYRFVTYAWDEVDEKWEESLKSNKQPIAGWRHHLKFTADGKRCEVLKEKRH